MSPLHILLALIVAIVWGINFLFVKIGLQEISPLWLCTIRFILASIPAIFFIKPPTAPIKMVALYGIVMFALQFSLVFVGMHTGMTAGMGSLIMQVQVFFSMFFAAIFLKEPPYIWQTIGAIVAFSGIALVGFHLDQNISLTGFVFILAAAAVWGFGNLITKKLQKVNMISLVVWGSFYAILPMTAISMIFEGPSKLVYTYHHLTWLGTSAVLYIVYLSTWVGYGVWNYLLSKHPVSTVVPFTLLVPIIGMVSSVLVFGEAFHLWKLFAGLLVISGLCINLLGAKLFIRKIQPQTEAALESN